MLPPPSIALLSFFTALTLLIAALFAVGVFLASVRSGLPRLTARRHTLIAVAAVALWMAATGVAAARGILHFDGTPTMLPVFPLIFALAIGIALSPLGRRLAFALPLSVLVGYQGFRVAVELLMHRAVTEGLAPVQMSYSGRNFDIVTGLSAIALGIWLAMGHRSRVLVLIWNALGIALLGNVLVVALLSAPTRFRVFTNEPANIWVTHAPWIWLPAVMVLAAVLGHALVIRRLLFGGASAEIPDAAAA